MLQVESDLGRWEDDGGAVGGQYGEPAARLLLPYMAAAVRAQEDLDDGAGTVVAHGPPDDLV